MVSAAGPHMPDRDRCLAAARSLGLGDEDSTVVADQLFAALRDLAAVDPARLVEIEPKPLFNARWDDGE